MTSRFKWARLIFSTIIFLRLIISTIISTNLILLHNLNFEEMISSIRDCTIKYKVELEYYSCVSWHLHSLNHKELGLVDFNVFLHYEYREDTQRQWDVLQVGDARMIYHCHQWSDLEHWFSMVKTSHDWYSYSDYDKQSRAKHVQSMIDQVLQCLRL